MRGILCPYLFWGTANNWTDNIEFIINSGKPQGVLEPKFLEDVNRFTEWLKVQPEVAHVYAISDVMKRLNKNLNAE